MTASTSRQTTGCWLYDIEWLYTAWVLALFDTYSFIDEQEVGQDMVGVDFSGGCICMVQYRYIVKWDNGIPWKMSASHDHGNDQVAGTREKKRQISIY